MVACGNEQLFGIDYGLNFAAVMVLSTVKVILVLVMSWVVPASTSTFPMRMLKLKKNKVLEIFLAITQGM